MQREHRKLILIVGPTGAGKTALSLQVAAHYQTSIISADSRQCFRELNIGVAKPSADDLQNIRHYFINSHSVKEEVNASVFEQLALGWADEIFSTRSVAVMAGGTGLYVRAFCEGLDEIPAVSESVRAEVRDNFEKLGMDWLISRIRDLDPHYYTTGEMQNPQRMMRALEVRMGTGRTLFSYRHPKSRPREFEIRKFGIQWPKELLHRNIHARVDQMMESGLLEEVKSLAPFRSLNALQTVGYKELFEYLEGKTSLDKAIDQIKKNTRQYAKRQMTWFRKDPAIQWIDPGNLEKIIKS